MTWLSKSPTARVSTARPNPPIRDLRVTFTGDGWALMVDDLQTPAWVVSRKARAMAAATDAAKFHRALLTVETRAGDVHARTHFGSATPLS